MTHTNRRSDYQIQADIVKRLDWSPDVAAEHIGVAVTDDAVTLSGEASTTVEKAAAIRAATEVRDVAVVADEIIVRESEHEDNDADIARAVQRVVDRAESAVCADVTATVHDHTVVLSGMVDTQAQRHGLGSGVQAVSGVRSVIDQLVVRPTPSSGKVKEQVIEALRLGVEYEAAHVQVEVRGHITTLSGTVHSWYERREAERAAASVDGVTDVDNQLIVAS